MHASTKKIQVEQKSRSDYFPSLFCLLSAEISSSAVHHVPTGENTLRWGLPAELRSRHLHTGPDAAPLGCFHSFDLWPCWFLFDALLCAFVVLHSTCFKFRVQKYVWIYFDLVTMNPKILTANTRALVQPEWNWNGRMCFLMGQQWPRPLHVPQPCLHPITCSWWSSCNV